MKNILLALLIASFCTTSAFALTIDRSDDRQTLTMDGELFTYDDSKSVLTSDKKDFVTATGYINDSGSTIVVIFSHKVDSRAYAVVILTMPANPALSMSGSVEGFEDFDCDGKFKPFDIHGIKLILPDCARAD